jgi:transcriptional regulator with XRE-family HTH domain
MNWKQLRQEWHDDPEWVAGLEREYPHRRVADSVVALRVQYGLTQQQLAERAKVQQSVISRLESGQHSCEIDLLDRIAAAVGTEWRPAFAPVFARQAALYQAPLAIHGPTAFFTLNMPLLGSSFRYASVPYNKIPSQAEPLDDDRETQPALALAS